MYLLLSDDFNFPSYPWSDEYLMIEGLLYFPCVYCDYHQGFSVLIYYYKTNSQSNFSQNNLKDINIFLTLF